MVTDPTTGTMVTAPKYGGTLTYPHNRASEIVDPFTVGPEAGWLIDGVNEKLAYGNWGLNREEYDFVVWPFFQRNFQSFGLNIRNPPFDDVRVRRAADGTGPEHDQ